MGGVNPLFGPAREALDRVLGSLRLPYPIGLDLIERLWKFVKAECLNSVYYESFPEFRKATDDCLKKTGTEYKSQLDTLLTLKFQRFKSAS